MSESNKNPQSVLDNFFSLYETCEEQSEAIPITDLQTAAREVLACWSDLPVEKTSGYLTHIKIKFTECLPNLIERGIISDREKELLKDFVLSGIKRVDHRSILAKTMTAVGKSDAAQLLSGHLTSILAEFLPDLANPDNPEDRQYLALEICATPAAIRERPGQLYSDLMHSLNHSNHEIIRLVVQLAAMPHVMDELGAQNLQTLIRKSEEQMKGSSPPFPITIPDLRNLVAARFPLPEHSCAGACPA